MEEDWFFFMTSLPIQAYFQSSLSPVCTIKRSCSGTRKGDKKKNREGNIKNIKNMCSVSLTSQTNSRVMFIYFVHLSFASNKALPTNICKRHSRKFLIEDS